MLRYVGFTTGSALSAVVLESHTTRGSALPDPGGYGVAAALGVVICAAATVIAAVLPRRHRDEAALPTKDGGSTAVEGSGQPDGSTTVHADQVRS
ncbi:hypothetical protein ACWGQ5_56365 [Streptomyces sp. NPDC055722]